MRERIRVKRRNKRAAKSAAKKEAKKEAKAAALAAAQPKVVELVARQDDPGQQPHDPGQAADQQWGWDEAGWVQTPAGSFHWGNDHSDAAWWAHIHQ